MMPRTLCLIQIVLRRYRGILERILNAENEGNGEVTCPEVMGPCYLISE